MDPLADDEAKKALGEDPNDTNKIKSDGLRIVFSSTRDQFPLNPCPYYDDGDPSMYTKENMDLRQ